jgi:hypothetical protein
MINVSSDSEYDQIVSRATIGSEIMHFGSAFFLFNVLVYAYLAINVPLWGYLGYTEDFSWSRYFVASLALFFVKAITPRRIDSYYSFTIVVFSALSITTMAVLFAARGYDPLYFVAVISFFALISLIPRIVDFKIAARRSSHLPIVVLSSGVILLTLFWVASKGGLSRLSFNISDMYAVRRDVEGVYFQGPFIYLNNWAAKIFAPALLAFGLMNRRYGIALFAIVAEVIFYGAFAQKTPIALIGFTLFSIWAVPRRFRTAAMETLFGVIVSAAMFLYFSYGEVLSSAIVVNRTFFGPAMNNVHYFEFFREAQFTYFSNSFLKGVIDYPYGQHVFDIISTIRTGDVGINPNTGALGTGYMHIGYFGLFLYAIVIGILISIIEGLSKYHRAWVAVAVAGPPTFIMLTSTDLAVALVTNGLALSVVLLFLWPRETNTAERD